MKKIEEIFDIIILAICHAVPLVFIAFFAKRAGWNGFLVMATPIYCAWHVGRMTGFSKWEREFGAKKNLEGEIDNQDEDD